VTVTWYCPAGVAGVLDIDAPLLLQPARAANTNIAPARAYLVRSRRAAGTLHKRPSAVISKSKVRGETGVVFLGTEGSDAAVVKVTVAVPGAVTGLVTVQVPCGMLPVQVIATEPVNPPNAPMVAVTVPGVP
jgi:hypothetical protein